MYFEPYDADVIFGDDLARAVIDYGYGYSDILMLGLATKSATCSFGTTLFFRVLEVTKCFLVISQLSQDTTPKYM